MFCFINLLVTVFIIVQHAVCFAHPSSALSTALSSSSSSSVCFDQRSLPFPTMLSEHHHQDGRRYGGI